MQTTDRKGTSIFDQEETRRREFLKKVGKTAVTAPAVAMLLAASTKPAEAHNRYGSQDKKHNKKRRKPRKRRDR